jgi:hypothetical protein
MLLVERLRDAGAIIIGKTNLSEWANVLHNPVQDGAVEADKQKTLIF